MIILFILIFIVAVAYCGLILYYATIFKVIKEYNLDPRSNQTPITLISVIIPARNEEDNIEGCIQSLLQQTYPPQLFEIIIVDDFSEDKTAEIIKSYSSKRLTLISLNNYVSTKINSYKKKAIEIAVAKATGDLIVTTDADCIFHKDWLMSIATFYEEKKPVFIAAPVTIDCGWRFIEIFQSLDFMTLQGITACVVSRGQMSMCNGANMAYEKKVFNEVNGFADIDKVASGDDMMLMHKINKAYTSKTMFLHSTSAIVKTAPVHTFKSFFQQRIRWASKAEKYDDKRILPVLALIYMFNVIMLLLPLICVFYNPSILIFNRSISLFDIWLWIFLFKIISELIFMIPVATFYNKKNMLWFFPFMQPFHIVYTVIAGWLGKFGKYSWKQRIVK